jgi:hypothetical protein
MLEGIEYKFIVINKKRFEEMKECSLKVDDKGKTLFQAGVAVSKFLAALHEFSLEYSKITGKDLDQKYLVVNQDEPYAEEVWKLIKNKSLKVGDYVLYCAGHKNEKGRVKSIAHEPGFVFVVYHCAGEWDRYMNYTSARTEVSDLERLTKEEFYAI